MSRVLPHGGVCTCTSVKRCSTSSTTGIRRTETRHGHHLSFVSPSHISFCSPSQHGCHISCFVYLRRTQNHIFISCCSPLDWMEQGPGKNPLNCGTGPDKGAHPGIYFKITFFITLRSFLIFSQGMMNGHIWGPNISTC